MTGAQRIARASDASDGHGRKKDRGKETGISKRPFDQRRMTPDAAVVAGCAKAMIVPPLGAPVHGWGARSDQTSTGRHNTLQAVALALGPASGDRATAVIVSTDIGLWPSAIAERVRASISARTGLDAESIQLAASHTHSSVMMDDATIATWEVHGLAAQARSAVEEAVIDAATRAVHSVEPARVRSVRRACGIARSRRQNVAGRILVGVADAVPDAYLDMISVDTLVGRPMASIVVYGAHPTILAWGSLDWSPDYVGMLRQLVEREIGGMCLFLQGCGGDRAPASSLSNRSEDADSVGRALAFAAIAAAAEGRDLALQPTFVRAVESGAPLAVNETALADPRRVRVDSRSYPFELSLGDHEPGRAGRRVAAARDSLAAGEAGASVEVARALIELDIAERFDRGGPGRLSVGVVRVGELVLLFWPGELSGAYERAFQGHNASHVVTVTNANDNVNYLPTAEQFSEGGYEVDASPFTARTEAEAVTQVHHLLRNFGPE